MSVNNYIYAGSDKLRDPMRAESSRVIVVRARTAVITAARGNCERV